MSKRVTTIYSAYMVVIHNFLPISTQLAQYIIILAYLVYSQNYKEKHQVDILFF